MRRATAPHLIALPVCNTNPTQRFTRSQVIVIEFAIAGIFCSQCQMRSRA